MRTLYLCYFGLRAPLVQTQVLPYLRELSRRGIDVTLLTFEPRRSELDVGEEKIRLRNDGIKWSRLCYHKWPSLPATLYDTMAGALRAVRLARRLGVDALHARAHVPMAMALLARPFTGCRVIFDVRGLMADEYRDAGIWTESSLPFQLVKLMERVGFQRADQLVVLTERLRAWIVARGLATPARVQVIPCCVDRERFAACGDCAHPRSPRFELVYAGSTVGLYLLEEMSRFFLALRRRKPDAFFRVLTGNSAQATIDTMTRCGVSPDDYWVGKVAPTEVPCLLGRASLGISFRKSTFSQIAASPTKIPEYLMAGLPVVCNVGIGDVDQWLERERVGVLVRGFGDDTLAEAVEQVLQLLDDPELVARCRRVVRRRFDLVEVGVARYSEVYRRLQRSSRQPVN